MPQITTNEDTLALFHNFANAYAMLHTSGIPYEDPIFDDSIRSFLDQFPNPPEPSTEPKPVLGYVISNKNNPGGSLDGFYYGMRTDAFASLLAQPATVQAKFQVISVTQSDYTVEPW